MLNGYQLNMKQYRSGLKERKFDSKHVEITHTRVPNLRHIPIIKRILFVVLSFAYCDNFTTFYFFHGRSVRSISDIFTHAITVIVVVHYTYQIEFDFDVLVSI